MKMKTLQFKKIDAFTANGSSGNPAGYVYLAPGESLSEAEMQQMGRELKGFVSEVGFVSPQADHYRLRYYSSECEVAFCGHASIAIMYDLLNRQEQAPAEVQIEVNAGRLTVYNDIKDSNAVYIMAPEPLYLPCPVNAQETAAILGMTVDEINPLLPLRLIDAGLRTLLVPLLRLKTCLRLLPDQAALKTFCEGHDIDIVHVFTGETALPENRYRTRVFAPRFGYLEDPATGSGNSAFGFYLLEEKLWPGDFSIEQGPDATHPNVVKIKRSNQEGKERILFGGCASTRIEGCYYLAV
ncbi:MAG: PhzF family phenazine biosynthesis protein [Anaerolineae bacterium]|nr:PhzF family phenazine biosynthesis protein [Anaerolineae bacterium]